MNNKKNNNNNNQQQQESRMTNNQTKLKTERDEREKDKDHHQG